MLLAIVKLYELLGFDFTDFNIDIKYDYLTENIARNGRSVLWYIDETHNAAIYVDTLELLTDEEIEKELC